MDSLTYFKDRVRSLWLSVLKQEPLSSNGFCCVSLDSNGLSLAYLKKNRGIPELQLLEARPCDETSFLPVLSSLVTQHHLENIASCWVLDPSKYKLLTLDELPVTDEEFQAAIRWQIRKSLPFPIEDAFIDKVSIPPSQIANPKKMMLVVAAQASYIQPLAEQIIKSGLNLAAIDIQELAIRNITACFENDDAISALVYLQKNTSTLVITRKKLFYFSRNLDWDSELLASTTQNQESTNPYLDKLALEIQRSFDYFQSQWRLPTPTRVLIAAVNPHMSNVDAYLSQRLRFPIENLNLNTILASVPQLTPNIDFQYLPVIGGVLREEISYATEN
jgi:MSHA biogenesis protein MshI